MEEIGVGDRPSHSWFRPGCPQAFLINLRSILRQFLLHVDFGQGPKKPRMPIFSEISHFQYWGVGFSDIFGDFGLAGRGPKTADFLLICLPQAHWWRRSRHQPAWHRQIWRQSAYEAGAKHAAICLPSSRRQVCESVLWEDPLENRIRRAFGPWRVEIISQTN